MKPIFVFASWGKVFLLSVIVMLLCQGAANCDDKPDPVKDYYSLITRLKSGDTSVDYEKLRYSFAQTKEYDPYGKYPEERKAMLKALDNKEYEAAVNHAHAVLAKNYLDMESHFVCSIAYREDGNAKMNAFHTTVLKGLIGSLYRSGNGQSQETAYIVISTDEEYFMFNMNGYRTIRQSLTEKNGMHFDKMEVENEKSGVKSTIYFNVEFPYRWINYKHKGSSD